MVRNPPGVLGEGQAVSGYGGALVQRPQFSSGRPLRVCLGGLQKLECWSPAHSQPGWSVGKRAERWEEWLDRIRCQEPSGHRQLQMEGWTLERTCRQKAGYQGGALESQVPGQPDGHSSLREGRAGEGVGLQVPATASVASLAAFILLG